METTLEAPIQTVDMIERTRLLLTRLEQLAEQGVHVDSAQLLRQGDGINIDIAMADFARLFAGQEANVYHGQSYDILSTQRDADGVEYQAYRRHPDLPKREIVNMPAVAPLPSQGEAESGGQPVGASGLFPSSTGQK